MSRSHAKFEESHLSAYDKLRQSRTLVVLQIVLPLLAIIVPITLYFLSSTKSEVTISGMQHTYLINPQEEIARDVKVRYKGVEKGNLARFELEIKNTGNTSIDRSDVHYIRWLPPRGSSILEAQVISKTEGFGDFIRVNIKLPDTLEFFLLTLNKNSAAQISVLCAFDSAKYDVNECRAVGVITDAKVVDNSLAFLQAQDPSYFTSLFGGSIWVIMGRLVSFFIIGLTLAILGISVLLRLDEISDERKLKKLVKNFLATGELPSKSDIKNSHELSKTLQYLSPLSIPQLELIIRLSQNSAKRQSIEEYINGLSEQNKKIFDSLPNKVFVGQLSMFDSIYKTRFVSGVILRERIGS